MVIITFILTTLIAAVAYFAMLAFVVFLLNVIIGLMIGKEREEY